MPDEGGVDRRSGARSEGEGGHPAGAGRAFCGGNDFSEGFHHWDERISTDGQWDAGKDVVFTTAQELAATWKFMSLWRSPEPVMRKRTVGATRSAS